MAAQAGGKNTTPDSTGLQKSDIDAIFPRIVSSEVPGVWWEPAKENGMTREEAERRHLLRTLQRRGSWRIHRNCAALA